MHKEIENTITAFDIAAEVYDILEEQNFLMKEMRKKVWEVYLNLISEGAKILELNCGTGTDAVFLSQEGYNVLATDGSEEMIKLLNSKIALFNLKNCKSELKSFNKISEIQDSEFDAVISNFGGLNCIDDFYELKKNIYSKLSKNGKFIAVVMNKFCPWEIFYYLLKFNFKGAFRRFNKKGIEGDLYGQKVRTFYFSPGSFTKNFKNEFSVKSIYTLSLFTPPPFLFGLEKRFPSLISFFIKMDKLVWNLYPFNRAGDHFIAVLEK